MGNLKDVLSLRPIYHQVESRVRGHRFVAALALLVQTYLERCLKDGKVNLSAVAALEAVETIGHVTFKRNDGDRSGVSKGSARAQQVLRALGIKKVKPPAPPVGEEEIK